MNAHSFRREIGIGGLTLTGIGAVIGSGWLFGAFHAAHSVGPVSVISWIIGGFAMLFLALSYAQIGGVISEAGGSVRFPQYTHGSLFATLVGWASWLTQSSIPPTEATALVQYLNGYVPGLYSGGRLTALGILFSLALMFLFVILNYFGVRLFARINNFVTVVKLLVPALTILLVFATAFHPGNFTQFGGFAPHGVGGALTAIATSGVIFSFLGFKPIIDFGAEGKNAKRSVPLAVIFTIMFAMIFYLLLQIVFIGGLPQSTLTHGWGGLKFNSPFAQLALSINLAWLAILIYADAWISPSGSSFVITSSNARTSYALAANGIFPKFLLRLHPRYAVPHVALFTNFLVGIVFLLPLPSWNLIVAVASSVGLFTYSSAAISAVSLVRLQIQGKTPVKGIQVIAPIGFVVGSLIIFWAGWHSGSHATFALLAGVVLYLWTWSRQKWGMAQFRSGLFFVVYLVGLIFMQYAGTFGGGRGIVGRPWDSIVVAVFSLLIFYWGVGSGVKYMQESNSLHEMRTLNQTDDSELSI
ncbi:APC family permease [Alicyclobacillus tolerans]|uniref:APC family permease n=1 Tax=Alicyclobacillus tolerans TaxID=90970 RepID=UPI001F32D1FE|nr:APC family permease [Alicyclobacillus tolerans]MCF8564274.1 APC family permease [Alicyclobacillus tolerans]